MAGKPHRDPVSGRYARRPVADVDAESAFDPMANDIENIDNVSGADWPGAKLYPHHAPAGDDLAQGGQRSPLRPRTPRLVGDRDRDTTELHARPRRETLCPDGPGETGRALPAQVRYITGNLGPAQPSPLRARNPVLVHPDDADHETWGTQGAVLRSAARGTGADEPVRYLVGGMDHDG